MKKIIITSSFNLAMNAHPNVERLSESWITYRLNIFMNYTCKSLIQQTNQSFIYFLKYDPVSEDIIIKTLSQYPPLPSNIIFIPFKEASTYIKKQLVGYDYLYLVRIDADDMFHPTFIQQLIDYNPNPTTQVLINQKGYIYNIENNMLARWFYYSPPFYTMIYNAHDYIEGKIKVFSGGHKYAFDFNHEILNNENFMVIVHGKNTETKFFSDFNTGLIEDLNEKKLILTQFNINK